MKATIVIQGDHSVGIPTNEVSVDFGNSFIECLHGASYEPEEREILRKQLAEFFGELFDGRARVYFSDECFDCGKILKNNKCSNSNCISNLPEEK